MKQCFKKDKTEVRHFKNQILFSVSFGGVVFAILLLVNFVDYLTEVLP